MLYLFCQFEFWSSPLSLLIVMKSSMTAYWWQAYKIIYFTKLVLDLDHHFLFYQNLDCILAKAKILWIWRNVTFLYLVITYRACNAIIPQLFCNTLYTVYLKIICSQSTFYFIYILNLDLKMLLLKIYENKIYSIR